jgi:hypothetical protein
MDGEHIFEVSVYDDCGCDGEPAYAKINFTKRLRDKIRRHMVITEALNKDDYIFCLDSFEGVVTWLNEDKEEDENIRMECEMLRVGKKDFRFRATIKHTDIRVMFGDTYDPENKGFFQPGDISRKEAIEEGCKDLLKLLGGTKMQEVVTLAAIGEEVKRG